MVELKDVIHYYIGQRFVYSSHHEPQGATYILRASMLSETLEFGDRPVLRRLEDMTEEEATELAKLQTAPHRHADIEILCIEKDCVHYMDGSKWEGNGVSEYNDLYAYFHTLQPGQFHYLLQQGFDLFGLVDSGQAIDSKTLKESKP